MRVAVTKCREKIYKGLVIASSHSDVNKAWQDRKGGNYVGVITNRDGGYSLELGQKCKNCKYLHFFKNNNRLNSYIEPKTIRASVINSTSSCE